MMHLSWEQEALWIRQHLPKMRFTLDSVPTIFTVWVEQYDEAETLRRISNIMKELFGAYLTGPCSTLSVRGQAAHQSFGFWNGQLIENARRVFPLPSGLQPGLLLLIGPQLSSAEWDRLRLAYDRQPGELNLVNRYRRQFEELKEEYQERFGQAEFELLVIQLPNGPHRVTYLSVDAIGVAINAERGVAAFADWKKGDRYKRLYDAMTWVDLPDGYRAPVMKSSGDAVWEVEPPRKEER